MRRLSFALVLLLAAGSAPAFAQDSTSSDHGGTIEQGAESSLDEDIQRRSLRAERDPSSTFQRSGARSGVRSSVLNRGPSHEGYVLSGRTSRRDRPVRRERFDYGTRTR